MREYINFLLLDADYSEDLERLQTILNGTGISVDVNRKVSSLGNCSVMTISYEEEKLRQKRTRNAGRHFIGYKGHYTCGEIREFKKKMTGKQLAKELNISVRTLYRRLKDNENMPDEELFI